jgi:hypothetical protein
MKKLIQFYSTDLGFLTSNIRVNWLFNHSIPLVSFLWPISYLSVHPTVDTFAPLAEEKSASRPSP